MASNSVRVFELMAESGPIGRELIKVLEAKGVPIQVWVVAMCQSLLSIQLDGKPVDDNFIIGIIKTIYKLKMEAEKLDDIDNKPSN